MPLCPDCREGAELQTTEKAKQKCDECGEWF